MRELHLMGESRLIRLGEEYLERHMKMVGYYEIGDELFLRITSCYQTTSAGTTIFWYTKTHAATTYT